MASWSHFLPGHIPVNPGQPQDRRQCFRSDSASSSPTASTTSLGVNIPGKFDPSRDPVLLRSLSSSSLQDMSRDPSDSAIACHPPDAALEASENSQIPRRNLTEAFEELYIEPSSDASTPAVKQLGEQNLDSKTTSMISPTGVAELGMETLDSSLTTPDQSSVRGTTSRVESRDEDDSRESAYHFFLHSDLTRDLSQALVNRVSFYGVIHDINKEASAMASNDESGYNRTPDEQQEQYDPLVVAVNGYPEVPLPEPSSMTKVALIDEEKWLLEAIDARGSDESRPVKACPPTFLQAMGERDYENPLASLSNGSRTQLWKPSRSWWEAKSGKNPWIEPKSHNKRWR